SLSSRRRKAGVLRDWSSVVCSSDLRRVLPSKKSALPVGVPAPGATGLTVAVKVTAWPNTDGLGAEVSAVVVPAWPTVWVSTGEEIGRASGREREKRAAVGGGRAGAG